MDLQQIAALAQPDGGRVVLLVLDGLGGLPLEAGGPTELEAAVTPHLDELARGGSCGLHEPVAAGVTPGSGPAHLSLFGYDPRHYRIGRGALEALGVGFHLQPGDIAVRGNLCTVDAVGNVTDRRAGRIATKDAAPLCESLDEIRVPGGEVFVRVVKEHRFLLVLRPECSSGAEIADTDPERTGVPPLEVQALSAGSEPAAAMARAWLKVAAETLAGEPLANMALLRGFSTLPDWPRFPAVFRMRSLGIAAYPMYRGVARLVGMEAREVEDDPAALVAEMESALGDYDFFFLHVKGTDKAGEDGDFARKVKVIEAVDAAIPRLLASGPDVLLVTGDHSTPALLRSHSWHPVPFLLYGGPRRASACDGFGESACARGSLGRRRGWELMPLAVARAGRLAKYGA